MWDSIWKNLAVILPPVVGGIVGIIGAIYAYNANMAKVRAESRSSTSTAEEKLRDDLLQIIDENKETKQKQDERIAELQRQIDALRAAYVLEVQNLNSQNTELRLQNANLQYDNAILRNDNARIVARVKDLEDEFAKSARRLYYDGSANNQNPS